MGVLERQEERERGIEEEGEGEGEVYKGHVERERERDGWMQCMEKLNYKTELLFLLFINFILFLSITCDLCAYLLICYAVNLLFCFFFSFPFLFWLRVTL